MSNYTCLKGILNERSREQILESWRIQIQQKINVLAPLSNEEVIDGMRKFLQISSEIAALGENDSPRKRDLLNESVQTCKDHGAKRVALSDFTLIDIKTEFRLLRSILMLKMTEETEHQTEDETETILELIDDGLSCSCVEFALRSGDSQNDSLKKILQEKKQLNGVIAEVSRQLNDLEVERKIREQFVLTLTHDLRTPLTAAKVSADLMLLKIKKFNDFSLCIDLSTRISDSLIRIDKMIKDLLDANQIRAGEEIRLSYNAFLLEEVVQNTAKIFITDVHRIKFNLQEGIVGVLDIEAIRRILENLLGNAIKYGFENSDILVSTMAHNEKVTISVENKGIPIPADKINGLFDPFKREEYGAVKKGWGLGLTLVKGLTEAHKGTINVVSNKSRTIFSITIPKNASI